jgi:hypothetical protein
VQAADKKYDTHQHECATLETAQRAWHQILEVFRVQRLSQQTGANHKAQQVLPTERPTERIHHLHAIVEISAIIAANMPKGDAFANAPYTLPADAVSGAMERKTQSARGAALAAPAPSPNAVAG